MVGEGGPSLPGVTETLCLVVFTSASCLSNEWVALQTRTFLMAPDLSSSCLFTNYSWMKLQRPPSAAKAPAAVLARTEGGRS